MHHLPLRKETSERSDRDNWAKQVLIEKSGYQFDGIEGCNQNSGHQITHLFERAFCEKLPGVFDKALFASSIKKIEGAQAVSNKISFCKSFGLPLSYVVYGNQPVEFVKLFSVDDKFKLDREFNSFKEFSDWIKSIKGWQSTSKFQHENELPEFDRALRRHGTAWPTNIDCFASKEGRPVAIVEFQNAHKTDLSKHDNNPYFWGLTPKDDQRRWFSQEVLRVRSGLPFVVVTWSRREPGFWLKKLEKVVFPNHADEGLKNLLREFARQRADGGNKLKTRQLYDEICRNSGSGELFFDGQNVQVRANRPPLYFEGKSFPMLYFSEKLWEPSDGGKLVEAFQKMVGDG